WGYLKRMRRAPREKGGGMAVTFALTVFVDLITPAPVGIILASFVDSRWLAAEQLKGWRQSCDGDDLEHLTSEEKALLKSAQGKVLVTLLHGSFSYASARELARRAAPSAIRHAVVIYDFSHAGYIDTSAALAIEEMIELSQKQGLAVLLSGLEGHALRALTGLRVLDRVPEAQ